MPGGAWLLPRRPAALSPVGDREPWPALRPTPHLWPGPRRQGERFDRQRHVCGTEVKAITYSAMQINETAGDAEVFVIVDI